MPDSRPPKTIQWSELGYLIRWYETILELAQRDYARANAPKALSEQLSAANGILATLKRNVKATVGKLKLAGYKMPAAWRAPYLKAASRIAL